MRPHIISSESTDISRDNFEGYVKPDSFHRDVYQNCSGCYRRGVLQFSDKFSPSLQFFFARIGIKEVSWIY